MINRWIRRHRYNVQMFIEENERHEHPFLNVQYLLLHADAIRRQRVLCAVCLCVCSEWMGAKLKIYSNETMHRLLFICHSIKFPCVSTRHWAHSNERQDKKKMLTSKWRIWIENWWNPLITKRYIINLSFCLRIAHKIRSEDVRRISYWLLRSSWFIIEIIFSFFVS